MGQRLGLKTRRARGSLGGNLRARQGSWLDLGVPRIWHVWCNLEPEVWQKPGKSGFMRWRLNGGERELGTRQQELTAGMSWNHDNCLCQEASYMPLAKAKCSIWNRVLRLAGGSRMRRRSWLNGQRRAAAKGSFWHPASLSLNLSRGPCLSPLSRS